MVVDIHPEEMESSSEETRSSNRRQDQQDDSGAMNSPTAPYTLFPTRSRTHLVLNTFRSHLSVLRASVNETDEDHHNVPHETAAKNNNRYINKTQDDMTWSEKLFVSPEDELVGENEWQNRMYGIDEADTFETEHHQRQWQQQQQPHEMKAEFNFEDATNVTPRDPHDDFSVRTDDCTHVTKLKRRKRGKKARDASMVGAFVTFLKALFGIGMLSNPAVLGETGLILGTFCHLFIVVGCAFACYLLLMSRQIAKQELVMKQQQQEFEKRRWESSTPLRTRMAILLGHQTKTESTGGNNNITADPNIIKKTPTRQNRASTPVSDNGSPRTNKTSVTDDYQLMTSSSPPPPPPNAPEKPQNTRLITYGDVAKYLAGERASVFIIFTIVAVHLMFASGMVCLAVENLCYVIGMDRLGWSVVEQEYIYDDDRANNFNYYQYTVNGDDNNGDDNGGNDDLYNDDDYNNARFLNSGSNSGSGDVDDTEQMYLQWEGADFSERLTMATMLFPIILLLLQIPSLRELATISSLGLFAYAFGCIGTMMYVSFVETSGHPFQDRPEDIWTAKWSGIPTYVATTVYAIEGINLALPTVISVEGIQRVWGLRKGMSKSQLGKETRSGESEESRGKIRPDLSVYIVCGAVFFYGFITLVVSWVGLAGGLGGGLGTIHESTGCRDVTYCLNSSGARFVYMLSLAVALILTLPVILYPSTEMLEIWLDEREEKRRKRMEAALQQIDQPREDAKSRGNLVKTIRQKSILQVRDDEDTFASASKSHEFELRDAQSAGSEFQQHVSLTIKTQTTEDKEQKNGPISPMEEERSVASSSLDRTKSARSSPRMRRLKYWKLRMFLAGTIIVIGTIEGSFPQVLKVAEVIRGVGLSIAGLIFPPLLYMSAVGGRFGTPMAAAMSLLVGLGLFNIVLVLMSSFGGKDYIMEEGSNFYEIDWSED